MKLWHLYPNPDRPGMATGLTDFDPWKRMDRDHVVGFIVRAEDEQAARSLVATGIDKHEWGEMPYAGDEDFYWDGDRYLRRESSVWLNPSLTICEELTADGDAKVIVINRGGMD